MPLLQIPLRAGKPEAYHQAIFDSLYCAMRETLDVSNDDQFMTITEHDAANFRYGAAFGIDRSDDLVFIRITVFDTRTGAEKKALFRRIAELLGESLAYGPRTRSLTSSKPRKRIGQSARVSRSLLETCHSPPTEVNRQ